MRLSPAMTFLAAPLLIAASFIRPDSYRIIHAYPHDQHAFTQGLVYLDGHLYESTGIRGQSTLREEDLETGRILRMQIVSDKYFAEGLTEWKNTLIQLTWQSHIALVYDRATFRLLRTFHYNGEGWGLTHDAKSLILSDGTATLRFYEPDTFKQLRRITVKDGGKPVTDLNETRIHPRPNLRQCLALQPNRAYLANKWPGSRLDRSKRPHAPRPALQR